MAYPKELVELGELLMVNTIQVDTMYQLLIQKGYFTEAEFLEKMKAVQMDYQGRGGFSGKPAFLEASRITSQ